MGLDSDVGGYGRTIQMNCYTPSAEIIDPQDATDHIAAHLIEHQDLPDWITILVQDRSGMRDKTASCGLIEGCVIRWL